MKLPYSYKSESINVLNIWIISTHPHLMLVYIEECDKRKEKVAGNGRPSQCFHLKWETENKTKINSFLQFIE